MEEIWCNLRVAIYVIQLAAASISNASFFVWNGFWLWHRKNDVSILNPAHKDQIGAVVSSTKETVANEQNTRPTVFEL